MSSTIFSATSGTSISVDPHADVEGAGQQNPAVPHDAQNGAPAPGNPPNEDLVQAEARLRQMLDTALDRSGGLRGIGGDLYDAIKNMKKALKTVGLLVLQCFSFCQRGKMQ